MYRSVNDYHRALENPNPWSGPRRDIVEEERRNIHFRVDGVLYKASKEGLKEEMTRRVGK